MRGVPKKRGRGRPPKTLYKRVRTRMETLGLSSVDIGNAIGVESSAVRRRLAGYTPWQLWEAYKVMDLLELPASEVYLYFPANGEEVESAGKQHIRAYLAETNQSLVSDSSLDALIALVHGIEEARMPGRGA